MSVGVSQLQLQVESPPRIRENETRDEPYDEWFAF